MLVFFSVLCIFPVITMPISYFSRSRGECLCLHVRKEKFFVVSSSFGIVVVVTYTRFSGSHHKLSSALIGTNFKQSYCGCCSIGVVWVTTVPCPPINSTALSRFFQGDVKDNNSHVFWLSFSCILCWVFLQLEMYQSSRVHDRSLL